ncbi:HAD-IA family hydrolase, partial [Candidatus Cyanaurora vandensis]
MIKAVFLDAAGTLIGVKGSVGEIYRQVAQDWGVDLDAAVLQQQFRQACQAVPPVDFSRGDWEAAERQWWYGVVWQTVGGEQFPDFAGYFAVLYDRFAQGEAWEPYPEVVAVLTVLQARGLPLVVVSNFDQRLIQVLRELGLSSYFQAVVYSSLVGHAKPDPAIFTYALARVQLRPAQVLHVGDSRRADLLGAQQAGLRA